MNIYLRYFNKETLVSTVDEAIDFLQGITDIDMDEFLMQDIKAFVESNNMYPKRYKVRGHSYFIVIKTTAATLEEFKDKGAAAREATEKARAQREERQLFFTAKKVGWYEGKLMFKRVISIPRHRSSSTWTPHSWHVCMPTLCRTATTPLSITCAPVLM